MNISYDQWIFENLKGRLKTFLLPWYKLYIHITGFLSKNIILENDKINISLYALLGKSIFKLQSNIMFCIILLHELSNQFEKFYRISQNMTSILLHHLQMELYDK
jgi:hypothetical protein